VYWWVLAKHRKRHILLGPFNNEPDATRKATEYSIAKVHMLDTKDDAKAARIIKYKMSLTDKDMVLERYGHKPKEKVSEVFNL